LVSLDEREHIKNAFVKCVATGFMLPVATLISRRLPHVTILHQLARFFPKEALDPFRTSFSPLAGFTTLNFVALFAAAQVPTYIYSAFGRSLSLDLDQLAIREASTSSSQSSHSTAETSKALPLPNSASVLREGGLFTHHLRWFDEWDNNVRMVKLNYQLVFHPVIMSHRWQPPFHGIMSNTQSASSFPSPAPSTSAPSSPSPADLASAANSSSSESFQSVLSAQSGGDGWLGARVLFNEPETRLSESVTAGLSPMPSLNEADQFKHKLDSHALLPNLLSAAEVQTTIEALEKLYRDERWTAVTPHESDRFRHLLGSAAL
jgi:hypothetical protein